MNIRNLDLNLLVVLDALLEERHVSRAAQRVHLSQPAMSNALGRLRDALDDPILVRTSRGMEPTPRALALQQPIRTALREIEQALARPARFEPASARHCFTIGASDYMEFVVLPLLLERVRAEAPNVDIVVRSLQLATPEEGLDSGDIDLAFGHFPDMPKQTGREHLFTERLVCAVRSDHPRVRDQLTLEQFLELPHLFVATRRAVAGVVDRALEERGLTRRIALTVPHFLVAPFIVARSDLIMTVNSRIADTFARSLPLRVLPPPVELPDFPICMVWHPRLERDPAQEWLRERLREVCGELAAGAGPAPAPARQR